MRDEPDSTVNGPQAAPPGPPTTPDGHHIIVNGRRWRASDPSIPDALRAELVAELMRARREVRTRGDAVRPCVQDAKVALGERGDPWWQQTPDGRRGRLASTMRTLLRHRDGSTICPSDAARVVGGQDWRGLMDTAREVAGELVARGEVRVQQKGVDVDLATVRGPIRLAAGPSLGR
ncbi:hypothetical protein FM114_08680 [Luteococcus japonicus LSP_Lj1]|uniref:DUF3253 domain-containing protein n=1 Tax=Luteococcus japonicus LSP_Lj1 TaxID=1255658 RepID=A0A1R4JNN7_9ACTN|nr:hypothetical protein FM114_08680 [Luteococcus japonicus LSP_Lj1]